MIIKSHQDTYQYTHDQKQAGFSADVGFDGKPQSFSINGSKTNVDTDYAQVIHQTGIKAQESTLQVQGKSEFTGGYFITDQGKNQTQFTQGIQTQDIQNHLNYQGDAISLGIGVADTSNPNGKAKPTLQGIGYGTITPAQPPTLPSLIKQGFLISTPQSVDGFAKHGTVSKITGKDGVVRDKLEIPGSYRGKKGVFEYIREPNGNINHRLFVPNEN